MSTGTLHTIDPERHDAVIFDLDGVIMRTADIHASAWKRVFDACLERAARREGRKAEPFDAEADYRRYIDGRPSSDGVRSFLESRGIFLPDGTEQDPPTAETIGGIGRRKNELFLELLAREGARLYGHAIDLAKRVRAAGLRTAVISSSRSGVQMLESVGVLDLFDATVDGLDAEERGLRGEPAPDFLLAAAGALGVEPGRSIVIEDALAGVEAGRAGGFGLVIGVDRGGQAESLRAHGADVVVSDLALLDVRPAAVARDDTAPSALAHVGEIEGQLRGRTPAVFLDYDGTLTPIVERPELAVLDARTRRAIEHLARCCTVAVVSGRDLADVRERVGIETIHYAGSHGFDIAGPKGLRHTHPEGVEALSQLDAAERRLRSALAGIDGALVDRKRFAIAVHFRLVADRDVPAIEAEVDAELARRPGLRKGRGKKVLELRPDVDWNKGAAVRWLLEALGLDHGNVVPIYVGDDVTDEDAFEALAQRSAGIGIVVLDHPRSTAAGYRLPDTDAVRTLLEDLARFLERRP